ncbi:MAG: MFS transporter, partial [Betaproteobacteria bacterium]
ILLSGLHMGITQGLLSTMVAATAPAGLRGTAFGVFSLVGGLTTLVASVLAGWLWDSWGAAFPFYAGAFFAAAAMVLIVMNKENSNARATG